MLRQRRSALLSAQCTGRLLPALLQTGLSETANQKARNVTSLAVTSNVVGKGPGGRSSVSGMSATVFGATGFVGRYVVQTLARTGTQVNVPYRGNDDDPRHLKLMGDLGQVLPMRFSWKDEDSIRNAIGKSNVVINLVGRDFETRNFSFDYVNIEIPEKIAKLAAERESVARLVHMSCLGASPDAPSKQHRTKALGEEAVFKAFPQATILRSAPIAGTEDRLLNSWAIQAKKLPGVPIVNGGRTRMQPVHVQDVASAVMAAVVDDGRSVGQLYELGGPDVMTMLDMVHLMFETIREPPSVMDIPLPIAKMLATPREMVLNRLPFPIPAPTMFTLDFIKSLEFDHVVSPDALKFEDLGLVPRPLRGVATEYLYSYRKGGPQYGETFGGERTSGAGF